MSDSGEEQDEIPSREVCEERCQEFASLTGTDSALAFCYLRKRKWCLESAVDAFFREQEKEQSGENNQSSAENGGTKMVSLTLKVPSTNAATASSTSSHISATSSAPDAEVDPQPHRVRVLSWNIDGLDTNNLKTRTKAVCNTIKQEKPDVVFLQEVVPPTLELIEELCPTFQVIPGATKGYFTAMMLSITSVEYKAHEVKQFYSSMMSRNLLVCQAKVKGVDVTLMTSHLESTASHAEERKKQLRALLKEMQSSPPGGAVIAGGDMNMRDKEIQEVGGLPEGILDLWEVTGKRPEAKFTWDLMRNDNLEWEKKFKPRCRFDRMFLRHPSSGTKLKPVYFELVGLERIQACKRFPSDHWGILAHFDKV